jgi:hypothetical protein
MVVIEIIKTFLNPNCCCCGGWGGMSFELIVGKEGEKKGKEKSLDSINVGISYF